MKSVAGRVTGVGYELSDTGRSVEHYAVVRVLISRSRRNGDAERRLAEIQEALLRKQVSIFPLADEPPREKGLTEYLEESP